ncbi:MULTISPECIES: hypothetical protein [unclassified Synechococcus]|uniref:hypothetical protein n=1 Tax=unclassified Synechococcus TaxID=2626047 RepID=UPI0021A616C0|nr:MULTISPECIES: hypothetical protein [unclassified Synechococcus]MCT0212764.1 hypothetical protein [Synechococcus sp. CS-1326]MCT0232596.1 hypothetical protein [Synechococcus sp. CS-1327]
MVSATSSTFLSRFLPLLPMSCPRCGSWNVRRDRSLAGRMVCGNCSMPLGKGQATSLGGRRRRLSGIGAGRGRIWRWALPLGLLLLVGAHLAQLSGRDQPSWPPAPQTLR